MANRLSPTAVITAVKDGDNPTLNTQALVENVNKVGSTYYLVYQTGNTTDTGVPWNIRLASASSIEGTWTDVGLLLQKSDVSWASATDDRLYAPELYKFGDTWYLYFGVVDWDSGTNGRIGVATASTITGTYTDSGAAILSPSAAGLWDSLRVGEPSVIYDGAQYVMAYMGEDSDLAFTESEQVGIATASSPTGPWTRAPNNPLLPIAASGAWDDEVVADPFLFIDSGYYWIWYTGGTTPPDGSPWSSGLAYATNVQGPWTKHASNPILSNGSAGQWDDEAAFRGSIYRETDGTYHVIYTGHAGSSVFRGGNATLTVTSSTDDVGIWIDFDRDGFGTNDAGTEEGLLARLLPEGGGSVDDNITTDVISYEIHRGAQSEITGGSVADSCTIIVRNDDGRYNPDNTASNVYGKLAPGCPVWIGVNGNGTVSGAGTVYGRFAGVVREIAPIPSGNAISATAEIICDGILADYDRTPVKLADSTTRSQYDFRFDVLEAIGESILRLDLDDEADTLPLSSADSTSALTVLEDLNRASGTRHFIRPSESLHHWYDYCSRSRHYRLGAAADDSVDAGAEHVTGVAGWRFNNDGIVNSQRATVDPATISAARTVVWTYEKAPFSVEGNQTIWAEFDDYVDDPSLDINVSSGSVTSSITSFGRSAKIDLWSTGALVSTLEVEGHAVVRDAAVTVFAEDPSSQNRYRKRAGSDITTELVGSQASAQGIVDHIVYRYGARPLKRPTLIVVNWLPDMFALDPYMLLGVTLDAVAASGVKFEIVGIVERGLRAASATVRHHEIDFLLAESRIQGTQTWFTLDTSTLNGDHLLAY